MTEFVFGQMPTSRSTLPQHLGHGRIRDVRGSIALRLTASRRVEPRVHAGRFYA
ncbi:hypothetical protein KY495_20550 [Massilia sp. PAMC28688]|uniref:hypothetical protein n=1 Tax=Massilia sp. PAMC28688 TaxID=2861283 RepID=UPI001C638C3D|nr:hypothetical protein [Massilia sp. PAMC28688]QYF93060.1 hypothetical protein KY495_20550 [Massilia sp. PAMC28688]